MNPAMNDTKWGELRLAMHGLGEMSPRWRTKDLSGYGSPWDGEWFYHFRGDGYGSIEWVEIQCTMPEQEAIVEAALRNVHLPGHKVDQSFCIYGYIKDGAFLSYI